ncbi:MAG TPA: DUF58 domain-containing protein [Saprospiraceae bacterium]|nr:DUF58 domain-containing protein [Saprospiraceae bacterium]
METSELLKKVRKIEIKTKGLSRHIFSGEYHSAFRGRGMSFSEVREYTYGDDVRNIDWNVTARTGHPHIKVFEEERELTVFLLIDVSGSSAYGSKTGLKNAMMTEIAAVLAFSAITNNDKVGALLFSDQIEKYLPPAKGKKNILRIIREMINIQPESKSTDIGKALEFLNSVQKKRSIVFLLSDFRSPSFETALMIASRRHDIIGLNIYDENERKIPDVGLVRMMDPESGEISIIDTSSTAVQNALRMQFEKLHREFSEQFKKNGCDTLSINTSEDYIKNLLQFFKSRGKR